jgi:glucokinase
MGVGDGVGDGLGDTRPALALDVGGTKLAAGVVDPGGRVLASARTPTPAGLDAELVWQTLDALFTSVVEKSGFTEAELAGVGCGCGGPMEWPAGRVSPLNLPAWRGFPLRDRLSERLPGLPVRVHNDAICLAAAEHWRGAGRGRSNMMGVVVATGMGAGLILDGKLISGATGNAGHIGHIVVDPDNGPACRCGGRGCAEAIVRGPALAEWARAQGWRPDQGDATARDLADDAAHGHPVALAAMSRAGRALGLAIASAAALCDLEVVTVGGGVSQAGPLLFDPLAETLRAYARLPFTRHLPVVPVALGQSVGLVGAAALILAPERYWTEPHDHGTLSANITGGVP